MNEHGDPERVVIKVGSSSLTTIDGGLDHARVRALARELAGLQANGARVVLVTSGAIAAGLAPLGLTRRPSDLETQQAAAAVGQGLLIRHYADEFAAYGCTVAQLLLTVDDVLRGDTYRNALNTISRLFRLGVIPIVNENDTTATHEIKFGDNDRLAALVAHLVRADTLVLLTDVDGLYTKHPSEPGSERIREVADVTKLSVDTSRLGSGIGTGGMRTKLEAAQIASQAGVEVILGSADDLPRILKCEDVGTKFAPVGKRRPRRLLWLAYAARTRGSLHVDAGAAEALRDTHASLLSAGIVRVEGNFNQGDPVGIVDPAGITFARGFTDASSEELKAEAYPGAVVHRDRLILLWNREPKPVNR